MDEIETAAADTTSESSSPFINLRPLPKHPHTFEEGEVYPKRRKIETDLSTPGFAFSESGLHSLEKTTPNKGSIRHYSGRMLPVGIAQPFRLREQSLDQNDSKSSLSDPKMDWTVEESSSSDPRKWENKHFQHTSADDACDSNNSQMTPRLDKVTRECTGIFGNVEGGVKQEHSSDSNSDSSDSSSESDSSSSFEFPFVPPSMEEEEEESGLGEEQEEGGDSLKTNPELAGRSFLSSPIASPSLPPGKKWHVFVSHSTGDKQWARESVIVPLRSPPHNFQVAACYNFMPDSSRYNDTDIHNSLRESCVILIGISPAYLNSQRCTREWQLAVHLAQDYHQCHLVVAAVAPCSRPGLLKSFLYLDFMDEKKHDAVWGMLVQTVGRAVQSLVPTHGDAGSGKEGFSEDQESGGERQSTRDAPHGAHRELEERCGSREQSPSSSNEDNYPGYDMEGFKQRMEAEFEKDFQQFSTEEEFGSLGGHTLAVSGQQVLSDPQQMIDIATTSKLVAQVSSEEQSDEGGHMIPPVEEEEEEGEEERGQEVKGQKKGGGLKDQGKGKCGDEVEEGEVSDSSSDLELAIGTQPHVQSKMVASFYNKLAAPDADNRNVSPIFHMRNFNNWVKSVLIRSYLPPDATVLDLCCGKGGDLLKWKEGHIKYLVCADISETSVEHCKGRYNSGKMIDRETGEPPYEAEFIVADLCETRLRDKYENPARRFHLSSIQFSLHYSFESYTKAHMMLRNACENLRPGGYLIGTTVDADELVRRLREVGKTEEGMWSISNEVFSVTLSPDLDLECLPLYGAKYNFKLHKVVDLPEFLVHFPLLITMLEEFDMKLVLHQNFYDFFNEHRYNAEDAHLMYRMQAFDKQSGTMSVAQWEVIGLYLVFVFQKRDLPSAAEGWQ